MRALVLAGLLAAAGAEALPAQVRPDTLPRDTSVVQIEGVVVNSVRATSTTGGTSALVVNPDSLHVVPAPTLEQVLREIPFVSVRENSRGEAEITVRGSDSRQVAVLVDGVPLTVGWDHRTDPSVIPITGAQSITLVRGLHSVLYGPNTLGGVIEVGISQGPPPLNVPPQLQMSAGLDQFGSRALSAVGGGAAQLTGGDLMVRVGAGYRARPGIALSGAVADRYTDDADLRANSDQDHVDAFLAARYHALGGSWLGLSASGYRAERGVPPELHVRKPRLWRYPEASRMLAVVSGGTGQRGTPWGRGDLEVSAGLDLGSQEIESFPTADYQTPTGWESGDGRTLTLRLLGDHSLGRTSTLTGALTYIDVHHDEVLDRTAENRYRQRLWSAATEVSVPVLGEGRLSGGVALDGADTPESGDKPPLGTISAWGGRLGISSLAMDNAVRLHAAVNRRARFPSLRELYSGSLGRFEPNPGLEPEKLLGFEAGAATRRAGAELQAVAFHHRLSDAIVREPAGQGRLRRTNRDRILSTGLELLADWRRGDWSLLADATLQEVSVEDPSATGGERRPEHQPGVRLGLNATAPLPLRLRALASAKYTGAQFCVHPDLETEVELDGSLSADFGVDRAWRLGAGPLLRTLRTSLSLDNVTDSAVFDQCGLPQPGRTLRFSVEVG